MNRHWSLELWPQFGVGLASEAEAADCLGETGLRTQLGQRTHAHNVKSRIIRLLADVELVLEIQSTLLIVGRIDNATHGGSQGVSELMGDPHAN